MSPNASVPGPRLESREVQWACSESLASVLAQTKSSLLISTYQTGHVVVVSAPQGRLEVTFHTFERPMGMAVRPGWLVVGTRTQIWSLRNFPDVAATVKPPGRHDACYLTRFSHFTGNIQCHELAWVSVGQAPDSQAGKPDLGNSTAGPAPANDQGRLELWIVNTLFFVSAVRLRPV